MKLCDRFEKAACTHRTPNNPEPSSASVVARGAHCAAATTLASRLAATSPRSNIHQRWYRGGISEVQRVRVVNHLLVFPDFGDAHGIYRLRERQLEVTAFVDISTLDLERFTMAEKTSDTRPSLSASWSSWCGVDARRRRSTREFGPFAWIIGLWVKRAAAAESARDHAC
jgi:hypothetical protein